MAVGTAGIQLSLGSAGELKLPWPIGAYIVGVTFFQYQMANVSGREIIEVALSVDANLTAPDSIFVQPNGVMKDTSGHNLDPSSFVIVGALAWSQDDTNVATMTAPGIPTGSASAAVQVPAGSAVQGSQAVLTGFDIAREGQHNLQYIRASVSSNLFTPLAATVRGAASFQDATGNVSTSATVDGAYFCTFNQPEAQLVAWTGPTQTPVDTQTTETVTFSTPVSNVALLLTSFSIQYPEGQDSQIGYMVVGATRLTNTGSDASFIPQAAMASGPLTSNPSVATGWVSLVAVGIP